MHTARFIERRVAPRRGARIVAVIALVLGTLGIGLLVWSILDSPLLALATAVLAVAMIALAFVAVSTTGTPRTLAVIGVVATLALIVILHVSRNLAEDEFRLNSLFGVVSLVLATVSARYALTIPPPTLDELLTVHEGRRSSRHPVLIINLKSGGGKAEQFGLVELCREHGIDTRVLERGMDLREVARDAVHAGADALGMAGGDGSLAFVAQVAADHDLPFVCVAAGTRNHFALDIGLDRDDPRQGIGAFINGEERRIDYATVNDQMFLNNVSLGVYAAIVAQDSYRDAKLDTTLQMLPKLVSEGGPWFDLHFDVPDHGRLEQSAILQVSNNPYAPGEFGRRSRLDTGQLGMVTADPQRLAALVNLTMLAAARQAERSSALWSWSAPSFQVESGQDEQHAGVDGETVVLRTPLRFAIVPRGLRLLVPRGSRVGLDEQKVAAKGTVSGLLSVALGLHSHDA